MTQGKSRMRQFRTSGSVRGVAREGDSYRDKDRFGAGAYLGILKISESFRIVQL